MCKLNVSEIEKFDNVKNTNSERTKKKKFDKIKVEFIIINKCTIYEWKM